MNTQDRDLVLALCQLRQMDADDEQFVDEVSAQVLDRHEALTPEQTRRALTLTEKYA